MRSGGRAPHIRMYKIKVSCELHATELLPTCVEPSAPINWKTLWVFRALEFVVNAKEFISAFFLFTNRCTSELS
jgi:hypothetical protein